MERSKYIFKIPISRFPNPKQMGKSFIKLVNKS